MRKLFRVVLISLVVGVLTACGTNPRSNVAPAVHPIAINLTALSPMSETAFPQQLGATVSYSGRSTESGNASISWSAAGSGRVTPDGLFSCTGLGAASVTASAENVTATTATSCDNSPMPQQNSVFIEHSVDFAGPFPSWLNVMIKYGAKGDGIADDTAALQAALNDQPRLHDVIWLPRGTYNLSRTLTLRDCYGASIIGEDPSNTIIRWTGPQGGTMLDISGCTATQISRITLDGSNIAGVAEHLWWSTTDGRYPTFNLLSDQTIKNANIGIQLGWAAEIAVERVHFDNDSSAGISQENWDSLNFNVRDSLFTNCGIGVTNTLGPNGSGAFNVTNSVFEGSRIADMAMGNTGPFSIRRNLSIGSHAFFTSSMIGAPALITFQGNRIISPSVIPIQIGTPSPIVLLDNNFLRMNSTMPILTGVSCCRPVQIFSVGNRGSSEVPFSGNVGRVKSVDDLFPTPATNPVVAAPAATYVPPRSTAKVFEVPLGSSSMTIQSLINQAAITPGGGIVHFPTGVFEIDKTLVVPNGGPVEIVGDGPFSSTLEGSPDLNGAILRLNSLKVRVAEIGLRQRVIDGRSPTAEGIQVSVPDVPSTDVVVDECKIGESNGLFVDGIDQAAVELFSCQLNSVTDSEPNSEFSGGPILKNGWYGFGHTNMFQGGTDLFTLENNARLLEEDFWHDGNEKGPAVSLEGGSGSVTISGADLHTATRYRTIISDRFKGSIDLVGIGSDYPIQLGQHSGNTSLLLAASYVGVETSNSPPVFLPVETAGETGAIAAVLNDDRSSNHSVTLTDSGGSSASWIEQMLSFLRTEAPQPKLMLAGNSARVRFDRIMIGGTRVGIHVMPGVASAVASSAPEYLLSDRSGMALDSASSSNCISEVPFSGDMFDTAWTIKLGIDGGIYLNAEGGSLADSAPNDQSHAVLASSLPDAHQEWVALPVGDGYFHLFNRATGQALTSAGSGGCAFLSTPTGSLEQEWGIAQADE